MLSDDELDEYVTSLLKNQAGKQAAAYSKIGFRAFLQSAEKEGPAGKPNTRFLKNIVRDVDGYNAALARKEEKESRERLKELKRRDGERLHGNKKEYRSSQNREEDWRARRGRERSRSPPRRRRESHGEERGRQRKHRREDSEDEGRKDSRHKKATHRQRSRHDEPEEEYRSRRRKERRSRTDSDEEENRRHHHREHRERHGDRDGRHSHRREGRHSRRSRSPERSRERHHHRKLTRDKHRSSPSDTSPPRSTHHQKGSHDHPSSDDVKRNQRDRSDSPHSIGPTVPIVGPEFLHAKGRGRMNGGTLDAKFSENYDPRTDVNDNDESDPDEKFVLDDWGLALRALRERQSYVSSGAMTERLRETQNQNQTSSWPTYGKGEREWDKGKVLLDDGSVGVKVWGVDKPV